VDVSEGTTCAGCGKILLSRTIGRSKQFCGGACRTSAGRFARVVAADYSAARSAVRSLAKDDFVTPSTFATTTVKTLAHTEITEPNFVTPEVVETKPSSAIHHQMGAITWCVCPRPDPASIGSGIMVCRYCLETIAPRESFVQA
jgi:hypothetical protein